MRQISDVSSLVNAMTGEPLARDIPRIKRAVQRSFGSSFICGYVAAERETYDEVVDCLIRELGIATGNIHEILPPLPCYGGHYYFLDRKEEYPGSPDDVHLVKALGFETIGALQNEEGWRIGHDYDQAFENTGPENWDGPKIVRVTHLGYSLGKETYEKAMEAATGSQFKHFLWEITAKAPGEQ